MSTTITLNALCTTIRQRADQIGSQTFDDASELKPWIRASLRQLQQILGNQDADWYTQSVPLTLHAGVEAYSMPSDLRRISNVYMLFAQGNSRIKLREFEYDNFGMLNVPVYQNAPMQYRLIRNLLYLQPTPAVDCFNALEISYVPEYRASLLDFVAIDDMIPGGATEWITMDVLQKMNVKIRLQNMDDIIKTKGMIEQRILRTFKNRSDVAPRMRDGTRYMPTPVGYTSPQGPLYWATA